MIDFSSISYFTLNRGDEVVSDGISTGGGIPFGSDTIYTVYVCVYLCAFISVHKTVACVQCKYHVQAQLCMMYCTITF